MDIMIISDSDMEIARKKLDDKIASYEKKFEAEKERLIMGNLEFMGTSVLVDTRTFEEDSSANIAKETVIAILDMLITDLKDKPDIKLEGYPMSRVDSFIGIRKLLTEPKVFKNEIPGSISYETDISKETLIKAWSLISSNFITRYDVVQFMELLLNVPKSLTSEH